VLPGDVAIPMAEFAIGSTVSGVVIELDGMSWKPVPGATATAEEFIAARSRIREIHQSSWWNPWLITDRGGEYDAAWEICRQWRRAEPDLPPKTLEEYEAEREQRLAEAQARAAAELEQAERDRAERAERYDAQRAQARLALLEEQGILSSKVRERDEILSRNLSAAAQDSRRDEHLAGLQAEIAGAQQVVDELAAAAGDPETVSDERGWLPAERRELSLTRFAAQRAAEVCDLRARIPARQAGLKTLTGQAERAERREALRKDTARLAALEAMPPMQAADMCSECVSPARHSPGATYNLDDGSVTGGPCPAWPRWAQKLEMLHRELRRRTSNPAEPPAPPPEPIAVISAGVPIEDIIAQLAKVQAHHPGADVRQGKRNRWEIWAPEHPPSP
jgi:hypothetical protein